MKPMSSLCNTNKVGFFCRILWGKFTLKTNFKMRIIIFFQKRSASDSEMSDEDESLFTWKTKV